MSILQKKKAHEYNSIFNLQLIFKEFISGHWYLPFSLLLYISKPAKVPFRTTGSDLHIYRKQRLVTKELATTPLFKNHAN